MTLLFAGAHGAQAQQEVPQLAKSVAKSSNDFGGYTLRVTTREVVIEVVARDQNSQPVNDLKPSDFQLFEGLRPSAEGLKPLSSFRVFDPAVDQSDDHLGSNVLPLGGRCEIRSTVHYEIAFHPVNWTSGHHSVLVTSTRRHVKLSYRKQFYVGLADIPTGRAHRDATTINTDLMSAACYHSSVPASLALSARRTGSDDEAKVRFGIKLLPGSLDLAGIRAGLGHVQLEYGVCTFTKAGHVIDFWHFSEDRLLTSAEFVSVASSGWPESVDVDRMGKAALARVVVLEPKTGNLGILDLSTDAQIPADAPEAPAVQNTTRILVHSEDVPLTRGVSALGSPVPRPGALCGDVYELPTTTSLLPGDFQVLNAVGAVYTNSLDVSEQILRQGIPGSTPRSEWFGVDYYGQFWITNPGKYLFLLNADDGADLYIDDHQLIGNDGIHPPRTVKASILLQAGRHSIHLPYFQGPTYVNLILQIKPPDGELKIFDIRDYAEPAHPSP